MLRFFDEGGGANAPSLIQAQRNFEEFGATERRVVHLVRRPLAEEARPADWRPIDPRVDHAELFDVGNDQDVSRPDYPEDTTTLYYWRPNYWRRRTG